MKAQQVPFPVAVIEAVLKAGVQEFVVCAGARNSALIVVLAALGDKVRLWQHFDERAAGFFAIGRIRATERPVAVVTTSGTAAAELLPAVIEAHYQGLPLVALTADRPKHFRGSGAPQAIEQAGLFGVYAECSLDWQESEGSARQIDFANGPVHVNACLPEPGDFGELRAGVKTWIRNLAGDSEEGTPAGFAMNSGGWSEERAEPTDSSSSLNPSGVRQCSAQPTVSPHWPTPPGLRDFFAAYQGIKPPAIHGEPLRGSTTAASAPSPGTLILAGDLLPSDLPSALSQTAHGADPIYAEAPSGLRDTPALQSRLLRCGDATLRHLDARHILRLGGVPSLRFWRDLESKPEIAVTHWTRSGYAGLARKETPRQDTDLHHQDAGPILSRDAALYARLAELLKQFPSSEPAIFRRLSQVIPQGAAVFTGNSMPVREWNLCAEYGRGHRVHVLRGANGIDGNVSAFLGIAADEPEAWCITGDLTTLYDLNAPWMLPQLSAGNRRFVVIQNAGGKIFSRLPSLKSLTERERALMENPHSISLRGWAEMWGMGHVSGSGEVLDSVMEQPAHTVIELHPDAAQTEAFWKAWAAAESEIWGT